MNPKINELLNRIRAQEVEVEQEIAARQEELRFRLKNRKVRFEREALALHRQLRVGALPGRHLQAASRLGARYLFDDPATAVPVSLSLCLPVGVHPPLSHRQGEAAR